MKITINENKYSDIKTNKECFNELKRLAMIERPKYVYHYTSLSPLMHIIGDGYIMLTRLDCSNDKAELKLCNGANNIYTFSFVNEGIEKVQMWNMYGNKNDVKVRLSLPKVIFNNISDNEFSYLDSSNNRKIIGKDKIDTVEFGNVCYIGKNGKSEDVVIRLNNNRIGLVPKDIDESLYGFIKYDIWKDEKEIRIVCKIIDENLISNDHIFMKLPKVLENGNNKILVRFNPWLDEATVKKLEKRVKKMAKGKNISLECKKSKYHGTIGNL